MAIETDFTLASYNSPFTVAEMDVFIIQVSAAHGSDGGWSSLNNTEKEDRILLSVNYVNGLKWNGTLNILVISPSMTWPRDGLTWQNGVAVDGDVTPGNIGQLMACWILTAIKGVSATVASGQVKKRTVDKVSLEYTTDADFVEKAAATPADTCIDTYVPGGWVISSIASSIGYVGLMRRP